VYVPCQSIDAYVHADGWDYFSDFRNVTAGTIEQITWNLCDGVLTISGEGDMPDYGFNTPWLDYASSITTIIIDEGITGIGYLAFYECSNVTSVTIPNSVTYIGGWSFAGCGNLSSITIPDGVISIGFAAFQQSGLTSVTIPNGIITIAQQTFHQ
jgi:hypothetical protein